MNPHNNKSSLLCLPELPLTDFPNLLNEIENVELLNNKNKQWSNKTKNK